MKVLNQCYECLEPWVTLHSEPVKTSVYGHWSLHKMQACHHLVVYRKTTCLKVLLSWDDRILIPVCPKARVTKLQTTFKPSSLNKSSPYWRVKMYSPPKQEKSMLKHIRLADLQLAFLCCEPTKPCYSALITYISQVMNHQVHTGSLNQTIWSLQTSVMLWNNIRPLCNLHQTCPSAAHCPPA